MRWISVSVLVSCLAVSLPLLVPGCAAEEDHAVYVERDPPPERVEVVTVAPGEGHVWVRGHWQWNGAEYVWIPGHWQRRPHPTAAWREGHWKHVRHGWVWIEGGWD